ncbi:MAG: hypothetical protein LBP73_07775 [Clostridiales Family XIII bacterium]|jgi:acyl-ACP thioesterase|nr:hypothetical protein [Clostridiales Family XIII bacterium]
MKNGFDKTYELRYFEMNRHGVASPTAILTLLEEAAAEHCHSIGYSPHILEKQNIGWVLVAGAMDMLRYPKYKESITIRTWISKYTPVRGYRENLILDAAGKTIGKAKGIWVFYDIIKMKPTPIFDEIKEKWGVNPDLSQEVDLAGIKIIEGGEPLTEYAVHQSDIDSNRHVNNIRYFHWLIDSLPDKTSEHCFLRRIDARFCSEAKYGEKIRVYRSEPEPDAFLHTMRSNADNRLFVAAHSVWNMAESPDAV